MEPRVHDDVIPFDLINSYEAVIEIISRQWDVIKWEELIPNEYPRYEVDCSKVLIVCLCDYQTKIPFVIENGDVYGGVIQLPCWNMSVSPHVGRVIEIPSGKSGWYSITKVQLGVPRYLRVFVK